MTTNKNTNKKARPTADTLRKDIRSVVKKTTDKTPHNSLEPYNKELTALFKTYNKVASSKKTVKIVA